MQHTTVTFRVLPDEDPDVSYLDEDRRAQWERELFTFIGIRAEGEIHDETNGVVTSVTSAGLWGIESDSDTDYLRSVGADELASLANELTARNINVDGITPTLTR